MLSIARTRNIKMGMALLAVSLASVSVSIDWSARGSALLSAWDQMAGLFAFGYHPVSATEWAALNRATEPICSESELPGRQFIAVSRCEKSDVQVEPSARILTAARVPVRNRYRREKGRVLVAAARRESGASLCPISCKVTLPVYHVNIARLVRFEQPAQVGEFTARASAIARYRVDLRKALRAWESKWAMIRIFKLVPAFIIESPDETLHWTDSKRKTRTRTDSEATGPVPFSCGP